MPFTFQGGPRVIEIGLVTWASPTRPCSDFTSSLLPDCEIENVELWQGRVSATQRYVPLRLEIAESAAGPEVGAMIAPSVADTSNSMGLFIFTSAIGISTLFCAKPSIVAHDVIDHPARNRAGF